MLFVIQSAAHFVLSDCGHYGNVVTATGETSRPCYTKRQAYAALARFISDELVHSDEIDEARRQIADSPLVTASEVLDDAVEEEYPDLVIKPKKNEKADERPQYLN